MSNEKKIYGFHSITSQIRLDPLAIKEIFIDEARSDGRVNDLTKLIKANEIKFHLSTKNRLDGMVASHKHQGVVAIVRGSQHQYVTIEDIVEENYDKTLLFLILDGVVDPHNLGACFRVADAMGVDALICPKDNAVGLNATVRKVACGGAESVPFVVVTNLARTIRYLKDSNVFVYGTDDDADKPLQKINFKGSIALVMGSEGKGMRRLTKELCDDIFSIPMMGQVESLNVSVASGVCLYEINRQKP
ncbi:MAG: 23S rRNA (guanosine(2251)-2'-O)-methyltransferase RlmB [Nitrosomonadales bacterium]|jgi:23S rRNA (guanosine2251-2'-O)-methyltransferase|nr:23S rRNA (guanosine(2251)-2'-O)-methyltransferase RlmB [Nitrosomonadales bacterium]MBT6015087.1 23S rRNA (guanosine(2251)-2'-O)-methyltransferase RlmB [Nitrosomonadales bacterium]